MLKDERAIVIYSSIILAVLGVLTPASTALGQEDSGAEASERESTEEEPSEQDEEASEYDEEDEQDEGPVVPEGMTLDETLDRAEQTPPEDYPDVVPDDKIRAFLLADQLEYRYDLQGQPDHVGTELQAYVGGDYNRIWLKTEGEVGWQGDAAIEGESENDLLYGRLISPFWTLQVGAQYANEWTDSEYEDIWAGAVALQGMAPGMFEVDASIYLTENLHVLATLEAEYDVRITQRLVFQPRVELGLAAQDVEERGLGIGLTSVVADVRLRYEFLRELAPYLGARFKGLTFGTADLAQAAGQDASRFFVLGGVRFALY